MRGEFYSASDLHQGIHRELSPGITTRIFAGERAMLSLVVLVPNACSQIHSHPQEQWGLVLEGTGVRIQDGVEIAVRAGDFWRTPGGVPHGFRAGAKGARLLDVFSPPREEYAECGADEGNEYARA